MIRWIISGSPRRVAEIRRSLGSLGVNLPHDGRSPVGGIGDLVERFTAATGLRRLSEAFSRLFFGRPCGCKARQRAANARWYGLWRWMMDWKSL